MLLSLWIVFLAFQLEKSKYGHCSKQFLGIFAAQAVFCISLTVYFIRHELAELGKPAGLSHEDPEMHELLVGERSGVPPGTLLFYHLLSRAYLHVHVLQVQTCT